MARDDKTHWLSFDWLRYEADMASDNKTHWLSFD